MTPHDRWILEQAIRTLCRIEAARKPILKPRRYTKNAAKSTARREQGSVSVCVYPMKPQLIEGQEVTLDSSQGHITRTVVADLGDVVLVTRAEEYQRARKAGNQPISVGFRRSDVLDAE